MSDIKIVDLSHIFNTTPPVPHITHMRNPTRLQVEAWVDSFGTKSFHYLIITDNTPRDRLDEMNDYSYLLPKPLGGCPELLDLRYCRVVQPFWDDREEVLVRYVDRIKKQILEPIPKSSAWDFKELDYL